MTSTSGFQFHKAVRARIRLLLGLSGPSGSGKTWTALLLAKGLSAGKRFKLIDTENGRASMYADYFDFDVLDLTAPFTSERYQEAILAADSDDGVIVVDSFSHEYEGDGGILDRQEHELDRMVKESIDRGDTRREWQLEDAHNMRAWNAAKQPHKKLMTKLLQLRSHVIFCMRADDKIEIVKQDNKTIVRPKQTLTGKDGFVPICEKRFPYELTASFLLTADKPGVPKPIKLQEQHRSFFPLDKPITEDAGRLIGEWAKGSKSVPPQAETKLPVKETKRGVYEPVSTAVPQSADDHKQKGESLSAVDYFKRIEMATSHEELAKIGVALVNVPLTSDDKQTCRNLFAARKKQLAQQAEPLEI